MPAPLNTQDTADAYLEAFRSRVNDGGGQAQIRFYDALPISQGGAGVPIATALLDTTTPFEAITTSGNYRQTVPTPEGGDADLTVVGLAAAGAGTPATHWELLAESGAIVEGGTCRATGDADNGEQAVFNNNNIAEGQAVTVTGFTKRILMMLGDI